jgi:hypothetical protein
MADCSWRSCVNGIERYKNIERYNNNCFIVKCTRIDWECIQVYLQVKNKITSIDVILVGFVTGIIQNFNAASDENKNVKWRLIKFWKP